MTRTDTSAVREFFEQQQADRRYQELKAKTAALDQAAAGHLAATVRGDVLCVGGVWDFFARTEQMRSITVLDLSLSMLNSYCPDGATKVEADLYEIEFAPSSYDTVVFPLMLHHTPAGDWRSSTRRVADAFERAHRWLRPGGQVLVVEYCARPILASMQRVLLPMTRRFLAAFGQPLVVMYSRRFYERTLAGRFDRVVAERVEPPGFDYWTWYPVFMSIDWLRLPLALYPKLHVLRATLADHSVT